MQTFYRRPLPDSLVAFSGAEGRALFREALEDGTMEGFFAVSEQFHTQAEPAFCGLGSLVVALNALGIDPGRLWKGPWRWFDETLLDCCVPLEDVKLRGLRLRELACLAECNGASARLVHASDAPADALRNALVTAARSSTGPVVVASYDRSTLGQTGSGHFSPVAGYHAPSDRALVLDVARFKYPPHWVPVETLHRAMLPNDPETGASRGWISLTASTARPLLLSLGLPSVGWRSFLGELRAEARRTLGDAPSAAWIAEQLAKHPRALAEIVVPLSGALGGDVAPEHAAKLEVLLGEIRATEAFAIASAALASADTGRGAEVITVLALVLGDPNETRAPLGPLLTDEVGALRRQLSALCSDGAVCTRTS